MCGTTEQNRNMRHTEMAASISWMFGRLWAALFHRRKASFWSLWQRRVALTVLLSSCVFLSCRPYRSGRSLNVVGTVQPSQPLSTTHHPNAYYIPSIRNNTVQQDWDFGSLIHIVNTRFMQDQGNLTALGEARLALFKVFCLPSMLQQSVHNFLWLIRVDPHLDPSMLAKIIRLVEQKNRSNIYVIASNVNWVFWRGGGEVQNLAQSKVYTGNRTRLEIAMSLHNKFPIVETGLDADDGLHEGYLQAIQETALQSWKAHPTMQWMFWCVHSHLEWFWMDELSQFPSDMSPPLKQELLRHGSWRGVKNEYCMTPGLSTAFGVPAKSWLVPNMGHHLLFDVIKGLNGQNSSLVSDCGLPQKADCIQFVKEFPYEAIRSRTPTSAGVRAIQPVEWELQYNLRKSMHYRNTARKSFAIPSAALQWINQFISDHIVDVARDNLRGQCTPGHSCEEEARQQLLQLVQSRNTTKA
jgi:Putative rhamnosyl transferase